jgi:hypothetical protein
LKAVHDDTVVETAGKHRKFSPGNLLLFLIALSPVIYLAWLLSATAVNIVVMDEWDYVFLFRHLASHTLTLHDLFQQHNESRTTLPNLIVLGLGVLTHWDTRWDMWVTFLFACVISTSVYLLSRRTMNGRQGLALWAIANLLIFSTEQSENWTWGIQMIVFMPIMFITLGMLIANSRLNVTWKFLICIALATASTYSYANGQLAWLLLLASLIFGSWEQTKRLGWLIWMWATACALNLWAYYRDYHQPPRHPSLLLLLKQPVKAMQYFAAFLGASLGKGFERIWVSVAFGLALLVFLAIMCGYVWRRRGPNGLAQSAIIWLTVAAYALASAVVTTAGRMGFGVEQSQDSRYTTFSLYLVIGLLYLGAIIVKDLYRRGKIASARTWGVLGLALILLPQTVMQAEGYQSMWLYRRSHLTEKACVQLLNISVVAPWLAYPRAAKVIDEAGFLDNAGYLSPGLVKGRDLSAIAADAKGESIGYIDMLTPLPDASWLAAGWAIDPKQAEQANVVILAAEDSRGDPRGFAVAIVKEQRPDVATARHNGAYATSGWDTTFKSTDVPPGTRTISAWEYDPMTGLAYRLEGGYRWQPRLSGP